MVFSSHKRAAEYVVFHIGEHLCGIDIAHIQEINRNIPVTRVYGSPPFVRGVINLRGQIVTIIDLAARLTDRPATEGGKNVIVQGQDELIGLLVDEVDDIITPGPTGILPPPPHLDPGIGQHAVGVLPTEDSLVIILDAASVVS
jgi:purine-binding chemotaxis protein CheW